MPLKLMLFFFLTTAWALADTQEKVLSGYDPRVDVISDEYEAGAFLIYDCEKGAWICVLEKYAQGCLKRREEQLMQKKNHLSCALIEELPTKKSCFQKQLFMLSQNMGTRFCLSERGKKEEL
jgi:hypothetical protein